MESGSIPADCMPYGKNNVSFGRAAGEVRDVARKGSHECLAAIEDLEARAERLDLLRSRIGDLSVDNFVREGPALVARYLSQDKRLAQQLRRANERAASSRTGRWVSPSAGGVLVSGPPRPGHWSSIGSLDRRPHALADASVMQRDRREQRAQRLGCERVSVPWCRLDSGNADGPAGGVGTGPADAFRTARLECGVLRIGTGPSGQRSRRHRMALRMRKSIKLGPGVRLNVSHRGAGVRVGGRGGGVSANTSGRRTASVGIPGSGVGYSKTTGGGGRRSRAAAAPVAPPAPPKPGMLASGYEKAFHKAVNAYAPATPRGAAPVPRVVREGHEGQGARR